MASEQLEGLRGLLEASPMDPAGPPQRWRDAIDMVGAMGTVADGVTVEVVDADGVPAELLRPSPAGPDAAVLYLHSGGYNFGSITSHRPMASRLAAAAGVPLLLIEYRLAPEHPFPAALDDARTAWDWLRRRGLTGDRLAVAGDSAGGGLTLVLATALRDEGEDLPAALTALSPWCDLTGTTPSSTENAGTDAVLSPALLATCAANYAAGRPLDDPRLSPRFADLSGLPPLLVQATDGELLVDDARLVVDAAASAGVDATLEVRSGLLHDWHLFAGSVPEADEDLATVGAFLRQHLRH